MESNNERTLKVNVLEGMKAVYKDKIFNVQKVFTSDNITIMSLYDDCVGERFETSFAKPLLKFPDKDSEGNECWSGDLVIDGDSTRINIIIHEKYRWKGLSLITGRGDVMTYPFPEDYKLCYIDECYTRLCSLYDKEASEFLDEETINKLKEIV